MRLCGGSRRTVQTAGGHCCLQPWRGAAAAVCAVAMGRVPKLKHGKAKNKDVKD